MDDISPCVCGKTPKIQIERKPTLAYYIRCCDHMVNVKPAFETEKYVESAQQTLVNAWNHTMAKKRKT